MKKLLFAAVICSFFFVGCKSSKDGNPNEVLNAWFDAMGKKDMTTVKELSTTESAALLGMLEMGMKDTSAGKEMDKFNKSKMEFGDAVITGDNAKVPVKDKASGETTNFPLKKEGGKWKVAFDKGSLMQMATEKMDKKEINMDSLKDSVGKGLDEIKKMNTDSLVDEVKKAMDTAKMQMH